MPRRDDIESILVIGSGPIVIGQACEFDYSGTQACKALREEGYRVILVNSNPATIMTDPETADRTYIEPITPEAVAKVIELERPDALLPTLGGQTGLNTAVTMDQDGTLERLGVRMIGADADVIRKAEDRELFKQAADACGLESPLSGKAGTMDEAWALLEDVGLPCVVRPSFTLGGSGGGIAWNREEFEEIVSQGLDLSMIHTVLIEESVLGWKEYELEVMRDHADNCVIICSIENVDPMGVHTGDSITVAPSMTLSDREYQRMRDAAFAVLREIGVETGGSNVQFAVNPADGRMVVIEMNPRVSRSSALASKATGFPIAKIAAKLAVGYRLDELPNDITRKTPAGFEPTIDYVVTKVPRFTFEKFPEADSTLTTSMKSVGEAMAIGRTFKESLQKALRSLETGRAGLGCDPKDEWLALAELSEERREKRITEALSTPTPDRIFMVRCAIKHGFDVDRISDLSGYDPWFVSAIEELVEYEEKLRRYKSLEELPPVMLREAKRMGFSDVQLATILRSSEEEVRNLRRLEDIRPVYKLVDTCAAEFEAATPYYYSSYETEDEARTDPDRPRILILGGGPNRIGQGIEFDYCCCHASFALREEGYETVMVNSNPETVSTDYDTSDRLFFEPLTAEDVIHICERVQPDGIIVQFGGQTPLNLARHLEEAGWPIVGTSPARIAQAEDREEFKSLLQDLDLVQPANGTAVNEEQATAVAEEVGYPVVVRPSFVLGGRAMAIVYDRESLLTYMREAVEAGPDHPVLIDKFLEDAIEVDVDAVSDGTDVVVGGIMEHIEEAGVHSGDSSCTLPPYSLTDRIVDELRDQTRRLALALDVKGLLNIQFAIKNDVVHVLEVNPRASRTVPFVSKAIGVPLAKIAAKVMIGIPLAEQGVTSETAPPRVAVKEPVFPFSRFPGADIVLGPEMRSTGEVMGWDDDLGLAFAKAHMGTGSRLPLEGTVFITVRDADKREVIFLAQKLEELGFEIVSTAGTHQVLTRNGVTCRRIKKLAEGRLNVADMIRSGEVDLILNTASGRGAKTDEAIMRGLAIRHEIPIITTLSGARAAVTGIAALARKDWGVRALQDAGEPAPAPSA